MSAFAAIIIATTPVPSAPVAPASAISLSTAAHTTASPLSIAVSQQSLPRHNRHHRLQLAPTIQADISGILTIDETQTSMVAVGIVHGDAADTAWQNPSLPAPPPAPNTLQNNAGQSETAQSEGDPLNPAALPNEPSSDAEPDAIDDDIIVVTAAEEAPKHDPLQKINAETYEVMQDVDATIVAPMAKAYEKGLPSPLRDGLNNFFNNLGEPVVFLNFLLQGKPGKAMETLGRFTINTTLGIAGLRDVAKTQPFNLPNRENGFSNTLGYYGIGHGPFFVLPLVGPTTLRDLAGGGVDNFVMPVGIAKPLGIGKYLTHPAVGASAFTLGSLNDRVEINDKLQNIQDSTNPYNVMRETYLCERKADIEALHNRQGPDCSIEAIEALIDGPLEEYEEELDESPAQVGIAPDNAPNYAPNNTSGNTFSNTPDYADAQAAADFISNADRLPTNAEVVEVQIEPAPIAATAG